MKINAKKKVLCVIGCLSSGGAERQLSMLANMLCDKYDITILTWIDFDDHYLLDERVQRIRISKGKSKYFKLINVICYILSHKYDCVLSYSQEDSFLALISLLFKPNVKAIAGERNYTKGNSSIVEKLLFRLFYRRANYIVPNSFSQGKYIKEETAFGNKVRVITNFTDINLYCPRTKKKYTPMIKLGVFARFAEQKNYRRFAEAISIVKKNSDVPFEVHWYGKMYSFGVENSGYTEYKELIERYNLHDIILLHDHVTDVANEMLKYDGIVLMSLHEGFSNVISEAICCGLPVLASDVSDNSVMVKHGYNGFLTNALSAEEMAAVIGKFIMLSPDERNIMGKNSRIIAESLFSKDSFKSNYINLIET